MTGSLALCDTPEKCDEQLSKLLLQLEELEGRFGEQPELTADLAAKREEVNDAVGARRQQLLDERHRRAQALMTAAERILSGIGRRAATFKTAEDLNAYFASDAMVLKLGDVEAQLHALGDDVRADEIASRRKTARQDALRTMRDRAELFDGGADVIKLGEHRFSVHTQPVELVLVPKDGTLTLHITGTDYFEAIQDPAARGGARPLGPDAAERVGRGLSRRVPRHVDAPRCGGGEALARDAHGGSAGPARWSRRCAPTRRTASTRATSAGSTTATRRSSSRSCSRSARRRDCSATRRTRARSASCGTPRSPMRSGRSSAPAREASVGFAPRPIRPAPRARSPTRSARRSPACARTLRLPDGKGDVSSAARYIVLELAEGGRSFTASAAADELKRSVLVFLDEEGGRRALEEELRTLEEHLTEQLGVALAYVDAFVEARKLESARPSCARRR